MTDDSAAPTEPPNVASLAARRAKRRRIPAPPTWRSVWVPPSAQDKERSRRGLANARAALEQARQQTRAGEEAERG